jgi:hypothetical protein
MAAQREGSCREFTCRPGNNHAGYLDLRNCHRSVRRFAVLLLPSNVWHHDVIASRPKLPERETPQAFAAQSRGDGWSFKAAIRPNGINPLG